MVQSFPSLYSWVNSSRAGHEIPPLLLPSSDKPLVELFRNMNVWSVCSYESPIVFFWHSQNGEREVLPMLLSSSTFLLPESMSEKEKKSSKTTTTTTVRKHKHCSQEYMYVCIHLLLYFLKFIIHIQRLRRPSVWQIC